GTLTFNAGELSKQIPLSILNNQTPELDETLTITLSSPTNAVLGANSVLGITITDDDPISVSLAMASVSINEAGASLALNVMLSHAALAPISVDYATQTGTADLADFTAASGTMTFGVGVSVQQIQLMIADDLTFEGDEDFSIAISSPVGAVLGATTSTTITITDDEATPSFNFSSVSLSAPETQGSVTLSVDLSPAASTALTIDVAT